MNDDLTDVMRSATENLYPNIGKLTAGGIERGVRRRRNRRITQVMGAAASVTAVFGVVAAVGAPGHGGSAGVSAAAGMTPAVAAQTSAAAVAPTSATATSSPTPGAATSTAPVSGEDMVKWLEQALQPYQFTGETVLYKAGTNEAAGPYATVRIGYQAGSGSVSLNVSRMPWSSVHLGGKVPYITVSTLKDGSHLMMFDGPEWPAGNGDPSAKRIEASWYRNDGTMVDFQVLNEVQEKGSTTATGLGLTTDQAAQVVQSPVWDKAIASVLAEPAPVIQTAPAGAKGGTTHSKGTDTGPGSNSGSGTSTSTSPGSGNGNSN